MFTSLSPLDRWRVVGYTHIHTQKISLIEKANSAKLSPFTLCEILSVLVSRSELANKL